MVRGKTDSFFGWRVMWSAFVVAIFGWGIGFYGPPVFLTTIVEAHGWPVSLVSAAVTTQFLVGALAIASLPPVYARHGVAAVTKGAVALVALGVVVWSIASQPWHIFAAAVLSGLGWGGTGALAINMIVNPWFDQKRPKAISTAYNGASVGGVILAPLWVLTIDAIGFFGAALMIGGTALVIIWTLSVRVFALRPEDLGQNVDGLTVTAAANKTQSTHISAKGLWTERRFATYVGGFTLGLFVQVGIIAHLISLLVPVAGTTVAGFAAGLATACAIVGRQLVGWFLPQNADRRIVAALTYVVQALGCLCFILSDGLSHGLLLAGIVLFGLGIGNVTSLPPLIVQREFPSDMGPRVIALGTATAQAAFAFAPAVFGLARDYAHLVPLGGGNVTTVFFAGAAILQVVAAVIYLAGLTCGSDTQTA